MRVFGDGPANAANRILPRLILVATETKFGIKWAITRHMYEISLRFLHLTRVLRVEQINNFNKSTMVDFRCLGNEIGRIFAKNWLELGNYEMSLDFSLTRLYKRSWSAILCNGQITAIIRLVKLALLKCFQAYIKRVMRAILVCLFIWPFHAYKRNFVQYCEQCRPAVTSCLASVVCFVQSRH